MIDKKFLRLEVEVDIETKEHFSKTRKVSFYIFSGFMNTIKLETKTSLKY